MPKTEDAAPVDKPHSRSSSFEKKHDSFKPPSMFARLKQAATSLITPEEKPASKESPATPAREPEPTVVAEPVQAVPKQEVQDRSDGASGDTSLDMVLDSSEPILFDLPSPMTHESSSPPKVSAMIL